MRKSKLFIILAALVLCVCLTCAALASESVLADLWASGCDLLFHTDNVTVTGEAVFSLDGEWFKTAKLEYVQDGYRSFYKLDLVTPREDDTEINSGWTIISDEEGYLSVMEVRHPGIYNAGVDDACNTLLRRSSELDAIAELGGLLIGQVEGLLPEGAVTAQDNTVHIVLAQDQIPAVAVSAVNLGFSYLCDRWFSYGHDRTLYPEEPLAFEGYTTVTEALANGTVYWALRGVDVEAATDDQGRLTAVKGAIQVASTFRDDTERLIEVQFDLSMTDYGASHVDDFDPDAYGVSLPDWYYGEEADGVAISGEECEYWVNEAVSLLNKQGYEVPENPDWSVWYSWNGTYCVELYPSDGTYYFCAFEIDGSVFTMGFMSSPWMSLEDEEAKDLDVETVAAAKSLAVSFLKENNPARAEYVDDFSVDSMCKSEEGFLYLNLYDDASSVYCVVRLEPDLRIEYIACDSNG